LAEAEKSMTGGTPASPGVVVQECAAGLVRVRQEEDRLAFAAPALLRSGDVDPALVDELVDILGVPRAQVVETAWLDNGPGWVGLLLDSAASVLALHPDATDHPGRWDIGVIGPHPSGAEAAFELRAFFTEGGEPLREDPVTGSLNAAAAGWLIDSGRAAAPFVAAQGTAMGRQGRIHISVDPEGTLWVGGNARTVVSGEAAL
jgi:PhzF family phenazine biosynthesis protein